MRKKIIKEYGIIGNPLIHSYSPQFFTEKFKEKNITDSAYLRFELPSIDDFRKLLQGHPQLRGLNVTIPYKQQVKPYLDEIDDKAKEIGAVNVIKITRDRENPWLKGYNSDWYGFEKSLKPMLKPWHTGALVLGTGGASKAVVFTLKTLGLDYRLVSRTKQEGMLTYGDLDEETMDKYKVIINTTPVGTYPNSYDTIIDLKDFEKCEAVIDLVYNPFKTPLLLQAEKLGMKISNGIPMLVAQALRSAEFFTGMSFRRYTADIIPELETYVKNIVIIGMPGSGKTTIGKAIAAATGRTFISTDEEIVKRAGRSIPEIFASDGEEAFRSMEQAVLKDICKESGLVIATGGGSVLRDENKDIIRCNSIAVEILRDYSLLSTEGRPLSEGKSAEDLEAMYAERKCHYDAVKDISVENNLAPEEVAKLIIDKIRRNSK